MLIALSIYILGIIAYLLTLWIGYQKLYRGTKITLGDLILYILPGVFSWIAFLLEIPIIYGNTPVLKKK